MAQIHINLTPHSELENKHWYLVEVMCVVAVIIVMTLYSNRKVSQIQQEIEDLRAQESEAQSDIANIKSLIEGRERELEEVEELEKRWRSLRSVDLVGPQQFESVMLMELLHTFKPTGVWFKSVEINPASKEVSVSAYSHEIALVAEFYRALFATQEQNSQNNDIRSSVAFREIKLGEIKESSFTIQGVSQSLSVQTFDIELRYELRSS